MQPDPLAIAMRTIAVRSLFGPPNDAEPHVAMARCILSLPGLVASWRELAAEVGRTDEQRAKAIARCADELERAIRGVP